MVNREMMQTGSMMVPNFAAIQNNQRSKLASQGIIGQIEDLIPPVNAFAPSSKKNFDQNFFAFE
jgi:hypothetical protein